MSGSEQEKALQQVQAGIQTALLLGLYSLAEPRVLEVSVMGRDVATFTASPSRGITMPSSGITEQGYAMPTAVKSYTPFEKQLLDCCWALVEIMTDQLTMGSELAIMS